MSSFIDTASMKSSSSLRIAMYPWLAIGHITQFLYLANKLAKKGHKVSFFIPMKTQSKIQHLNKFPNLIAFVPFAVPRVDGLPRGAETTADVEPPLRSYLATAMDRTEPDIETLLRALKPDLVFFDFAYWIPKLSRSLGFKSVYFSTVGPVFVSYITGYTSIASPEQRFLEPPPGFPDSSIKLHHHELPYFINMFSQKFGGNITIPDRMDITMKTCDVYASKGCREIDGPFIAFTEKRFNREIWLTGPILPESADEEVSAGLDLKWDGFLRKFERGSVVYCCFGSQERMSGVQFKELVRGLELCGRPFVAAVKLPEGMRSVEDALPEGFTERVGERGVVYEGWIDQQKILEHPSIGCFVTHTGAGSITEAFVNSCQLVMIPQGSDQFFLARMIANTLKAGIEVERDEENGWFSGESVSKAIQIVMCDEEGHDMSREIRINRAKLQKLLLNKDLEAGYIDNFSDNLQSLVIH